MKQSAGILLYRKNKKITEYFLVHPGGPFFRTKDAGWWSIPKGEIGPGEAPLQAAIREFEEETGYRPEGTFVPLQPIRQKSGKQVLCWATEGDLDPEKIVSNLFEIEWPPRSGKKKQFPEIDRAAWFDAETAKKMIYPQQAAFIEELLKARG
ncbi:NUDIX domain-containing protein [Chitinophaga oryzae]|uniref:NUDIX domain-containing protein n=1 Tax=Chitinophaga oryzae TaxID=2725414 RepID=A0AAE7D5T0_9BACT|nr:NUDIX domain-containing protein [Chitinophaga oryzae]QJB30419.1 NUDIX domain-containing protein [Chitinophaga oryzae]QJB36929.1 NUDIX domain-containing protein [Chitinophaga oryzae]